MPFSRLALILCSAGAVLQAQQPVQPLVVLVSIDGLKPEAVLQADAHHLKLPNLRAMVRDGVYAEGVTGVLPTLTYPSHTTILTGVSPARHGIFSNTTFDPYSKNQQGWYWYAEDIRVPTLWDAAHAAGLRTANVYWPVSVGANIDDNLAQLWRAGTADDLKLQRAVSTKGLVTELQTQANIPGAPNDATMDAAPGHYPGSEDETVADDEVRARYAVELLHLHHPRFMTVYFTGLDTQQHKTGPFSPEADAVLERIDVLVGQLRLAAEAELPHHAFLCIVSDHGFAAVQHDVNLYKAFVDAHLITLESASHAVATWRATLWPMGGSAAVLLHDPADTATKAEVDKLLAGLAANPASGIERVLSAAEIGRMGGLPVAESIVSMSPGYELGYQTTGPLISPATNGGMHGYPPDHPGMHSTFLLTGPNIPAHRSLGQIDMRRIAPTLAGLMNAQLPTADLPPLSLK